MFLVACLLTLILILLGTLIGGQIVRLTGLPRAISEEDMLTVYVTAEGSTIEHEGQMIPVVRLAFYNE